MDQWRKFSIVLLVFPLLLLGAVCAPSANTTSNINTATQTLDQTTESWEYGGLAVQGNFADAEVITLPDGQLRMYYSVEPEVPGNQLEMYSAVSADGVTWEQEAGTRMKFNTFPDVVRLSSGEYRIYTQNSQEIHSSISSDGLTFTSESGSRISKDGSGVPGVEQVGASTTTQLEDGTYLMVYRGDLPGAYSDDVPNQNGMSVLLWATSMDGLTFEQQGMAVDSRNETFYGLLDGPEWVRWSDGSLRLYFWSYYGVYFVTFQDGEFSDPMLTYSTARGGQTLFPPNPPGDPTLVQVNNTWFMYYGVHEQGIAYAKLK